MLNNKQGVVVLGHGSRHQAGLAVITETAARYQSQHPELKVVPAFIELAAPSLEDSATMLIEDGHTKVTVVPLFLSFGHHIATDLPHRMENLAEKYPQVTFVTTEPIGADPLLCDIIQARLDG